MHVVYICMYGTEEKKKKKKGLCSRINKMVNIKRLSTLKTDISKKQEIVISLGVHSNSVSLKFSVGKRPAMFLAFV